MSSINFGPAVLRTVPFSEPGCRPLRRRASAPELADANKIHENASPSYQAGNTVRLHLMSRLVQATIIRTFTPFTMAPVMVVRIFEPAIDLEGDFVLKVYDRRYSTEARDEEGDNNAWTVARDMGFEKRRWSSDFVKFFLHLMSSQHLDDTGDDFWDEEDEEDSESTGDEEEGLADAYTEMYFQVQCLKMYRAETEFYRRAREHHIDGVDIPRFISSVRIPPSYTSKYHHTQSSHIKGIPGVLLQYVPGFSMLRLYDTSSPPPPGPEHWKSIIDDGLRTVQYYMQNMEILNMDQNIARNTVVHWDPIGEKWKCKLIDFGHCQFRAKNMRKWEWRSCQAGLQEEAAVGRFMQAMLEKNTGFQYRWEQSQYSDELARDFRGEFSTGIEPSDYPS
ncbi:hypothetical protein C7974DRAFT_414790 [Boeremia exigua]|uniref:uncharacterized protein n=1 Tax=Boeremia exigua TaxID=749465 RepID=UPI001E8DC68F|nr:uncharacterized protein C7974DRAFT_414790 [Boeremia exigua]KAH6622124.1 hypothetical protein C7974DRAFT_414790 [Boeremia exigua]